MATEPDFDRPPVHVDERGTLRVRPADIFRSRIGQEQIRKTAALDAVREHWDRP